MNQKNLISILFTGLFLLNLFSANAASLLQIVTGIEVSIVNPFCKRTGDSKSNDKSETIDYVTAHSIQIPAVCTSVFDFQNPTFTFLLAEDNFKDYAFTDSFRLDLFSKQFYTPPRA